MKMQLGMLAVAMGTLPVAAWAKTAPLPTDQPGAFRALLDCRPIEPAEARLACYDRQVGAIADAQQKHDLVVVDRQQIREARRSLFGFSIPHLSIFGGGDKKADSEEPEFSRIETTIASARQNSQGRWVIELADGAEWLQIDNEDPATPPAAGKKIAIRKAAMGSYFANIAGQRAIRMQRVK